MDHPEWWDPYSCQPYKIPASDKPRLGFENLWEYLKVGTTFLGLSPLLAARYLTLKKAPAPPMEEFAGISIGTDQDFWQSQLEMLEDLRVRNVLIRIPSWDTSRLETYKSLVRSLEGYDVLVNVLQSRDSTRDVEGWKKQLYRIFETIGPLVNRFQIGNAVNRSKWGCRHTGDALALFKAADEVRARFPDIHLLGSSVIDFEPLLTLRTLVNGGGYHYDGCASLLYINRRGPVTGRQYGVFDLEAKIRLIKSMASLSNNCENRLWITETNWPLLNTKPYTPNSGHPRSTVDEETQARWLLDYFQVARDCGWVERVYWWQLINPGYGLVDHRGGKLRKMPSYHAFKSLFNP